MRFGISLPNTGDPTEVVRLAVSAEEAGWDGFFLWDHLVLDTEQDLDLMDPWVVLGAAAARTSRIRLGVMITPVARRRPWKLAKEIVTLDHLSGGRVIVGAGLGFPPEEFSRFGEEAAAKTRAAKLDEGLQLLDRFLRGDKVDHDGPHYSVHTRLRPPAVQRPRPPIWTAAILPATGALGRAPRWDGLFAIDNGNDGPLTPQVAAGLRADLGEGKDLVTIIGPDPDLAALADAGVTWGVESVYEPGEAGMQDVISAGPPATA